MIRAAIVQAISIAITIGVALFAAGLFISGLLIAFFYGMFIVAVTIVAFLGAIVHILSEKATTWTKRLKFWNSSK